MEIVLSYCSSIAKNSKNSFIAGETEHSCCRNGSPTKSSGDNNQQQQQRNAAAATVYVSAALSCDARCISCGYAT